jgi:hypothetical protein
MSKIKLQGNASGTGTTTFQSANTSSTVTFTLPGTDGSANQALVTDGSGNLTFASVGGSTTNALTMNSGGSGDASGTTFNGSAARTISYNTIGAVPLGGALGTPSSGTLSSCTVDGTNPVGFRNVPISSNSTNTLVVGDVGKVLSVTAGQTVPNSTFAAGDVVVIFNNSSSSITLTMSITTAYIAGTDTDKNTMTLATRGVATILFISSTVCVVSGNVS